MKTKHQQLEAEHAQLKEKFAQKEASVKAIEDQLSEVKKDKSVLFLQSTITKDKIVKLTQAEQNLKAEVERLYDEESGLFWPLARPELARRPSLTRTMQQVCNCSTASI